MEVFAMMGFILAFFAYTKTQRLERTLRENHIRPQRMTALGGHLREQIGQTVTITLYGPDGSTTRCKILDIDEEWVRLLRNEGKKNQRELLIRLEDVKQVKG